MAERIDITPEITRQIATRRAIGATLKDLETEFNYSRPVINRVLNSEVGRAIQKEILESAVVGAVAAIRRELAEMTELAMKALRENLKKNNMEAVKTYFKALGIETQERETGIQNQSITVVLPGQQVVKDVISEQE